MAPAAPPRTSSKKQDKNFAMVAANGNDRRASQMPIEAFNPTADAQTFRDLLIFEERLKQNAARLVKRKKKYQSE
jgi:hypothetical protein